MKVLLIVDVLNDFCRNGALAVPDGDAIIDPINRLLRSDAYDLKVGVKEQHPAGHISFASFHLHGVPFTSIETDCGPQWLWPDHAIINTWGGSYHPKLDTQFFTHEVIKGADPRVDCSGAFIDNFGLQETALPQLLRDEAARRGISMSQIEVDVAGLALDVCVKQTALDSLERYGLKTRVIVDATRAVNLNPGDDLKTLRELISKGVDVVDSREIVPVEVRRQKEIFLR